MVLAAQISWSESLEKALHTIEQSGKDDIGPVKQVQEIVDATLNVLADSVLCEQPPVRRRKLEHLVRTEVYFKSPRKEKKIDNASKKLCVKLFFTRTLGKDERFYFKTK